MEGWVGRGGLVVKRGCWGQVLGVVGRGVGGDKLVV